MDNNTKQPTILVKKSDGTFARMSLGEIKKMKVGKITAPSSVILNEMKDPLKLAVRDSSVATLPQNDNNKKVGMTGKDAKSLLEEDKLVAPGTSVAVGRNNQVDTVIKKLSFSVASNFFNRLRSAIQLRLKDVRGEKETRATVLRSIKDGGLGLTETQANELEQVCATVGNLLARPPAKSKTDLMVEDQILPQTFHKMPVPAKMAPHNAFVHEEFLKKEEKFKISPVAVSRPAMKDVVAAAAPVGPVEEIKFFTLTDFRRLAQDPNQATKRLAQKFINLREESVLLFWQALDAWKQSPLFADYVGVLNRVFIGKVASDQQKTSDQITDVEIKALIAMEKDLVI
ncbi:MAG: hypothetical protein A3J93_03705 [Candidatus Magasanikbacteria bacterium RIFOXYC2_FULL_42_28]|uniref:Uncharacterized protein n=1 Tax=Candidatus Magasanikbacteria bacterium RIFOXYC2_FULL_42_28 TaxID=1798704 RepID=A0A1F6NV62_9BACT|nr:MAG: hypothetical protein A3J93_03705 [Candidatus Magasanikbacteria bacterium RIFOXYC2_FULL_42_28]